MAYIKSFKGLKFNISKAGEFSELVCPPYDIIEKNEYNHYLSKNPYNIIRLELPTGNDKYRNAKKTLHSWEDKEILLQDKTDSIYIYEQEFMLNSKTIKLKGFISLVKLEDFSNGTILPHEKTLSKAKNDRLNLMKETFCNFSQIYSLYIDENKSIYSIIDNLSHKKADIELCDDKEIIHRLWNITDITVINKLATMFKEKKLYIADGHHRYETALNFRNWYNNNKQTSTNTNIDYVMMFLVNFDNNGLIILPTHRLVKGIPSFNLDDILNSCENFFYIEKYDSKETAITKLNELYSNNQKAFIMYVNKTFYLLILKDIKLIDKITNITSATKTLDVTILHELILKKIFKISEKDFENQVNLKYTKDLTKAISSVDNNDNQLAFILNPTKIDEIISISLLGDTMPQKSTYFYPKPITGLVMNKII